MTRLAQLQRPPSPRCGHPAVTARQAAGIATAAAALALGCAPGAARAWGSLLLIDAAPATATFAAGPSLWSLPAYPGAGATRRVLIPGLDFYAPSGFYASTDTALGWNFSPRPAVQAGARLWPQFGARAGDVPAGIDAVGTRLQAEVYANAQVLPALLLQSGLLQGAGRRRDGTQLELGATSGLPLGDGLLGIGVAATWANRRYRESYFGISAAASAASGLPAWQLPGGWQDVSLTLSGEHRIGAGWRLDAQLVVARLLGAAAQSPLVQSRRQTGATATLWHSF
jgi:outer membrane scaffolding protein for murein synthesis (MipA/OmpV family)